MAPAAASTKTHNADLLRRAIAAYHRAGELERTGDTSRVVRRQELTYVVLRSKAGDVLAVYRVRTYDGVLRRMKRWPAAVTS
jgi:hypothetical protein